MFICISPSGPRLPRAPVATAPSALTSVATATPTPLLPSPDIDRRSGSVCNRRSGSSFLYQILMYGICISSSSNACGVFFSCLRNGDSEPSYLIPFTLRYIVRCYKGQQCSLLELHLSESEAHYEKRIEEIANHLSNARTQVKELKTFLKTKSLKWKDKEHTFESFLNDQSGAFQELRAAMESVKAEIT